MILVDANLLVYAHVAGFRQHDPARDWLDRRLSGRDRVGLPWPSLLAFVRLVTNPRVFEQPQSVKAAWGQVERWLEAGPAWIPTPTGRHCEVLASVFERVNARGDLVPDAHLAALAIEHGPRAARHRRGFRPLSRLALGEPARLRPTRGSRRE